MRLTALSRPRHWSLPRWGLVNLLVMLGLVGFVLFLLQVNYRASGELKRTLLQRTDAEAARHAGDINHFFCERVSDLASLATSAQVEGFVRGREVGMSMTYGLSASLPLIENLFAMTRDYRRTEDHPIYSRIALLDDDGKEILAVPAQPAGPAERVPVPLPARTTRPIPVLTAGGNRLLFSVGCQPGAGARGCQIIAWIDADSLVRTVRSSQVGTDTLMWIKVGEAEVADALTPAAHPGLAAVRFPAMPPSEPGVGKAVALTVDGKPQVFLNYRFPLQAEPAVLEVAFRVPAPPSVLSGSRPLVIGSVLAIVVLGAAFAILHLNLRSLVLKVRLDESVLEKQGAEERNRVLELEIQERKRIQVALAKSEQNYREIFNATTDAILIQDLESGRILDANKAAIELLGCGSDEVTGSLPDLLGNAQPPFTAEKILARIWQSRLEGPQVFEWALCRSRGDQLWTEVALRTSEIGGRGRVLAVVRDITDRKRGEKDRLTLQEHLSQAQKMESVGRLAGGVAHDFNNLLTAILGNVEMALRDLPTDQGEVREALVEVDKAGHRAGDLTRQLLAFSRKQMLQVRPLDLNELIKGFTKMLTRLIGEDIEVKHQPEEGVGFVRADPSQIEQVILNLAVNARDAMPHGGKLTLATSSVTVSPGATPLPEGLAPGPHVQLTVSDTGCGMDRETQKRVFEPFFTTKGVGKGTGLGLATVYGIVRQHGGHVSFESRPGHGTTFRILLPRASEKAEPKPKLNPLTLPARGSETVMVVEDEPAVRKLTCRMLTNQGYRVIEARDGREAIRLAREWDHIHLLLTDVIMPQMSGREVYEQIAGIRPGIKVLFTSGYNDDVIAHHGILESRIHFLHKPFTAQTLTEKIRHVLTS